MMFRGGLVALALAVAGCSAELEPVQPVYISEGNPALLSEWGMMAANGQTLQLSEGVLPYDLNTALFTDYAHKQRTIWMPDGVHASYREGEVLDFPVGTVITKTFYYPRAGETVLRTLERAEGWREDGLDLDGVRLMETRILVHRDSGWVALPYVWNEGQTEARLARAGHVEMLTLVSENGNDSGPNDFAYVVPNANQCAGCHAVNNTTRAIQPIGPAPRHINRLYSYNGEDQNQLAVLHDRGYLDALPDTVAPAATDYLDSTADLDRRARDYLDINCAHCHNPVGPADTSGLHLNSDAPADVNLGLCKLPIAAGGGTGNRTYALTPGAPHESIMLYRMEITDPGAMMPELGRSLVHDEGVQLIREWIAALPGSCA